MPFLPPTLLENFPFLLFSFFPIASGPNQDLQTLNNCVRSYSGFFSGQINFYFNFLLPVSPPFWEQSLCSDQTNMNSSCRCLCYLHKHSFSLIFNGQNQPPSFYSSLQVRLIHPFLVQIQPPHRSICKTKIQGSEFHIHLS